ncbi:MAG: extracellular elastinolytic metalloproteinase, partial [Solirubrobacteraceae bacterium]|nr:extracellular elastinolytic metalloproteinase [Solirubrobacteraceae bacterium]
RRDVLGLSEADVAGLDGGRVVSGARGSSVVHFRQLYRGIPAFDNDLRVGLDSDGRVLSVAGSPRPGLSVASIEPALSGSQALTALQRDVGAVRAVDVRSGPDGVRRETRFDGGDIARLVIFGAASDALLAWHVTYRATSTAHYDAVVDARSGAILYRQNLVKNANALVYERHPGAAAPITVDLAQYGLNPGATALDGTYSRAWSDVNDDDEINAGEDVPPSAGSDFVYPFTPFLTQPACTATEPCAWDPALRTSWQVNRAQNAVQAFYLVSRYHDHLADPGVGFDDASGNFEVGGTDGDDPVLTQADDGAATAPDGGPDISHLNNANMDTPPDGESPRMQMYLFEDSEDPDGPDFRSINGGDDAAVVWHEYTHGLSNRLVTNADGTGALSTAQAGAMGEAWSDWFAMDYLVALGLQDDHLDTPGEIDVGDYSDADPHTLRTQPLDCPVSALTVACPGGAATSTGGYSYGDMSNISGAGPEVHSDGEIWSETLWDLRQQLLVWLSGDADTASFIAEALVSDGMRFSPPEPSMLEMRNAILAAEQNFSGGQLHDLVWDVFRKRGMGFYAGASDGADTDPVEDFQGPPDPGGPTGTITGVVTNADTGLPLEGVGVSVGGHAANPDSSLAHELATTTGADGRYTISDVPEGMYPKLAFAGSTGFLPVVARNVRVVQDAPAVRDATLRRNWAALSGGATIVSVSDDTGADAGCGVDEAFDSALGTTWSAFNPDTDLPDNPHAGPPTAVVQLPATIDVTRFEIDPSAGCGDGLSASTREFTIETSLDGTTWQTAVDGHGALAFTDDDVGRLNTREPAGTTGTGVRFVRVTLLNPLREDPACDPNHCSGTDFIDLSELEVVGAPPNVLPSGSLAATPDPVKVGATVTFDASSFTDPDSKITGYDWDFDGDGSVDRSTAQPSTSFAYDSVGAHTAKVAVKDFRGGTATAARTVTVTALDPLPTGPQGPAGPAGPA